MDACSTEIEGEKSRRCFFLATTLLEATGPRGPEQDGLGERARERERVERRERGSRNHEQVQGTRHHVARINDSRPRRRYEARKHFPFFSSAALGALPSPPGDYAPRGRSRIPVRPVPADRSRDAGYYSR